MDYINSVGIWITLSWNMKNLQSCLLFLQIWKFFPPGQVSTVEEKE